MKDEKRVLKTSLQVMAEVFGCAGPPEPEDLASMCSSASRAPSTSVCEEHSFVVHYLVDLGIYGK